MKALTIKQPWASLIINGHKQYEIRSWKTSYRGKILIHAGTGTDTQFLDPFDDYNLEYVNAVIIGQADLIDCILIDEDFNQKLKKLNNQIYHDSVGYYAWKLDKINITKCSHCHEPIEQHKVCKNCGYYKGKEVVVKKEEAKK